MTPLKIGILVSIPLLAPVANEVYSHSPWTPELLTGLGILLTTILAGVGKLIVDVRAGNKVTERVLIVSDGRLTAVMRTNARLARALARLTKDPEDIQAAQDAEDDLVKKYEQDAEQKAQ